VSFHVPESARLRTHGTAADGNNGVFLLDLLGCRPLQVIASDGLGWEHVSVSLRRQPRQTPSWNEMCAVKALFWGEEDCVVQYHPPRSSYVNFHPGTLHLWRPTSEFLPTPLPIMVGPVAANAVGG